MNILKFSENLKLALQQHEMTQQDLADKLDTSQATVNRWINGVNEPDLATFLEICLYLNETPNAILGYDNLSVEIIDAYSQKNK